MHFKSLSISVVVIIIFFRVPTCELCTYLFYVAFFCALLDWLTALTLNLHDTFYVGYLDFALPGCMPQCVASHPDPFLDFCGPHAKMCRPTVFEWLWMKCICPCFTPPWIALVESARETVSHPRLAMLSNCCFSLEQEALQHSHYMIWQFFT